MSTDFSDLEPVVADVGLAISVVREMHDNILDRRRATKRTGGFYEFVLTKQQMELLSYVVLEAMAKADEMEKAYFAALESDATRRRAEANNDHEKANGGQP